MDSDFIAMHREGTNRPHPGIVYAEQRAGLTVGEIVRGLARIARVYEPRELADRLEYLTRSLAQGL